MENPNIWVVQFAICYFRKVIWKVTWTKDALYTWVNSGDSAMLPLQLTHPKIWGAIWINISNNKEASIFCSCCPKEMKDLFTEDVHMYIVLWSGYFFQRCSFTELGKPTNNLRRTKDWKILPVFSLRQLSLFHLFLALLPVALTGCVQIALLAPWQVIWNLELIYSSSTEYETQCCRELRSKKGFGTQLQSGFLHWPFLAVWPWEVT